MSKARTDAAIRKSIDESGKTIELLTEDIKDMKVINKKLTGDDLKEAKEFLEGKKNLLEEEKEKLTGYKAEATISYNAPASKEQRAQDYKEYVSHLPRWRRYTTHSITFRTVCAVVIGAGLIVAGKVLGGEAESIEG